MGSACLEVVRRSEGLFVGGLTGGWPIMARGSGKSLRVGVHAGGARRVWGGTWRGSVAGRVSDWCACLECLRCSFNGMWFVGPILGGFLLSSWSFPLP